MEIDLEEQTLVKFTYPRSNEAWKESKSNRKYCILI